MMGKCMQSLPTVKTAGSYCYCYAIRASILIHRNVTVLTRNNKNFKLFILIRFVTPSGYGNPF
jgi:hypothetical protein